MFRMAVLPIGGAVVLLALALALPAIATTGTLVITEDTTLTEDHFGSIEIAADDVTLDCGGFSVIGPSGADWPVDGVLVDHHSGVTITNCVAQGLVNGFKLQGVTDSALLGNTATANEGNGFYASDSSRDNVFRDNMASASEVGHGFAFEFGSNRNLLEGSIAAGNTGNGIFVFRSRSNTFRGNVASDNGASGFASTSSSGNRFIGNVARGNVNGFASADARGDRWTDNVARGNSLAGFASLEGSREMRFGGNTARGNHLGFQVDRSDDNALVGNIARGGVGDLGTANAWRANESCRSDI
jgi:parallel beta-helix repeat protein